MSMSPRDERVAVVALGVAVDEHDRDRRVPAALERVLAALVRTQRRL